MSNRGSLTLGARRLGTVAIVLVLAACGLVENLANPPRAARWGLAEETVIGPETTFFIAMVTEMACASGRSSAGRIVGPEITYTEETVTVTFAVEPLNGAQDCPGNPSTAATVRLDQPLGNRELRDGGTDPPREPPRCRNADYCE